MEQIRITTRDEIDNLGSAPTFEGLAEESLNAMAETFEKEFGFNKSKVYILSGKDMNAAYGLYRNQRISRRFEYRFVGFQ